VMKPANQATLNRLLTLQEWIAENARWFHTDVGAVGDKVLRRTYAIPDIALVVFFAKRNFVIVYPEDERTWGDSRFWTFVRFTEMGSFLNFHEKLTVPRAEFAVAGKYDNKLQYAQQMMPSIDVFLYEVDFKLRGHLA